MPVCVYLFDMLSLGGRSLLQAPLSERRALLRASVNTVGGLVEPALGVEGSTAAELQEIFDRADELGVEGLVVSQL